MKLSRVLVVVAMVLAGMLSGTAEAVMVDFESSLYVAGQPWKGVDGWATLPITGFDASTLVTSSSQSPPFNTVLSGTQSGGIGGDARSVLSRPFDPGPTEFATGNYHTVLSCLVAADGPTGSSAGFFYGTSLSTGSTPGGIEAFIGGNFQLFGNTSGYYQDSGVPFVAGNTYKLEVELNFDNNNFKGYATNLTTSGPRVSLGTLGMIGANTAASYPISGFSIYTLGNAMAAYDDFDVYEVAATPDVPLLSNPVNFEHAVYVAGQPVQGKDGWIATLWTPNTEIVTAGALEGTKSLKLTGPQNALKRNFAADTVYGDGSIYQAKMKMLSSATQEGTAEFHFSHNIAENATPAGIIGMDDGNFWIYGMKNGEVVSEDGIDTGIPFLVNTEYLLEIQMDFTNGIFYSYATDLTNSGPRTMLGVAEFFEYPETIGQPVAGDVTNSGYVVVSRRQADVLYDAFDFIPGTLPVIKPGDANYNGVVDEYDAALLAQNWLAGPEATWGMGDFNKDGYVNDIDATLMAANWSGSGAPASVPEPSTLVGLLGLLVVALFIRRGR